VAGRRLGRAGVADGEHAQGVDGSVSWRSNRQFGHGPQ
jgi:hypothetical protein